MSAHKPSSLPALKRVVHRSLLRPWFIVAILILSVGWRAKFKKLIIIRSSAVCFIFLKSFFFLLLAICFVIRASVRSLRASTPQQVRTKGVASRRVVVDCVAWHHRVAVLVLVRVVEPGRNRLAGGPPCRPWWHRSLAKWLEKVTQLKFRALYEGHSWPVPKGQLAGWPFLF